MKVVRSVSIGLVLLLLPVFALASEQQRSVRIDQKVVVGNQTLKPGHYTVTYDDSHNKTDATFEMNGKTLATVPARIIHKSLHEGGGFEKPEYEVSHVDGQVRLRRVYLGDEQLVFGPQNAKNGTAQNNRPPLQ